MSELGNKIQKLVDQGDNADPAEVQGALRDFVSEHGREALTDAIRAGRD